MRSLFNICNICDDFQKLKLEFTIIANVVFMRSLLLAIIKRCTSMTKRATYLFHKDNFPITTYHYNLSYYFLLSYVHWFLFLILMLFNSTSRVFVSFRLNPFHLSLQLSFSETELLCHQLWLLSPGEESSISPYLWPSQFQQLQGRGW